MNIEIFTIFTIACGLILLFITAFFVGYRVKTDKIHPHLRASKTIDEQSRIMDEYEELVNDCLNRLENQNN